MSEFFFPTSKKVASISYRLATTCVFTTTSTHVCNIYNSTVNTHNFFAGGYY